MSRASVTLILGFAVGIIGVFAYNRFQAKAAEEDSEKLLNRICELMRSMEVERNGEHVLESA